MVTSSTSRSSWPTAPPYPLPAVITVPSVPATCTADRRGSVSSEPPEYSFSTWRSRSQGITLGAASPSITCAIPPSYRKIQSAFSRGAVLISAAPRATRMPAAPSTATRAAAWAAPAKARPGSNPSPIRKMPQPVRLEPRAARQERRYAPSSRACPRSRACASTCHCSRGRFTAATIRPCCPLTMPARASAGSPGHPPAPPKVRRSPPAPSPVWPVPSGRASSPSRCAPARRAPANCPAAPTRSVRSPSNTQ